jgi:hypothetical protein
MTHSFDDNFLSHYSLLASYSVSLSTCSAGCRNLTSLCCAQIYDDKGTLERLCDKKAVGAHAVASKGSNRCCRRSKSIAIWIDPSDLRDILRSRNIDISDEDFAYVRAISLICCC